MRVLRLLPYVLLFSVPLPAQTTTSANGDSQAIAVVQAAITALGGATAIGQAKSWTLQAVMRGAFGNANVNYAMSTDTHTGNIVLPNGQALSAPMTRSHLVPALVGKVLLNESQDPEFSILYGGTSTVDSKSVTVIIFTAGPAKLPGQIWFFDATNLPVRVDFRLAAEIGAKKSVFGTVALSDYRSVSGVLYPFRIIEFAQGEIITLQSVSSGPTASPDEPNALAGDSR